MQKYYFLFMLKLKSVFDLGPKNTFLTLHKWSFMATWLPTIFFVAYIIFCFVTPQFLLSSSKNPVFSEATMNEVDIEKRVSFFHKCILGGTLCVVFTSAILHWLQSKFFCKSHYKIYLGILSTIGICNLCATILKINSTMLCNIILQMIAIIVLISILEKFIKSKLPIRYPLYMICNFCFAIQTYFLLRFLFNSDTWFINNHVFFFIPCAMFWLLLHTFLLWRGVTLKKLLFVSSFISMIPLVIFISSEFAWYYVIEERKVTNFKVLTLTLVSVSFLIFYLYAKRRKKISIINVQKFIIYPSIIISIVVFSKYMPFFSQSNDIFELANPANSLMNIFVYNKLPHIDYLSSHLLFEQWYGIIYYLLFTFNYGLDYMAYEFFNDIIIFILVYLFCKHLFKAVWPALIISVMFPFIDAVFFAPIFICASTLLVIFKIINRQSVLNYILLFFNFILLFVWRLDSGNASLIATIFFLPLVFIFSKIKFNYIVFLKALCFTCGIIMILLLTAIYLRGGEYILNNLKCVLHYARGNQAHGYSVIANNYPHQFWLHYILLPGLAAIICIYSLLVIRQKGIEGIRGKSILASLFFFFLYFANFQRGLVRHSFAENVDFYLNSTIYLAIGLFVLAQFSYLAEYKRTIVLFVSLSGGYISLSFFELSASVSYFEQFSTKYSTYANKALINPTIIQLDSAIAANTRSRVKIDEPFCDRTFKEINNFFGTYLTKSQTFIDFSNTPMLYYYCKKSVPGYFCQNLQNTIDDYLQLQLIKSIKQMDVPITVYSWVPKTWYDETDGVPNSMRYYLLAEHIFKNYEPKFIINSRSIWKRKNFEISNTKLPIDSLSIKPVVHNYKWAAKQWGQYLNENKQNCFKNIYEINCEQYNYQLEANIELPQDVANLSQLFLFLKINCRDKEEPANVQLINNGEIKGEFVFNVKKGLNYYAVRLSSQYKWHAHNIQQIKIKKNSGTDVLVTSFIKDLRIES